MVFEAPGGEFMNIVENTEGKNVRNPTHVGQQKFLWNLSKALKGPNSSRKIFDILSKMVILLHAYNPNFEF